MNINYCELCGCGTAREKREILTLENSEGIANGLQNHRRASHTIDR